MQPTEKVTGKVELNVLGNVAQNPIDEIFYENRGRTSDLRRRDGQGRSPSWCLERVKVYKASVAWDDALVPPRRLLPHRPLPLGRTRATSSASTGRPTTATTSTSTTPTRPPASRSPASGPLDGLKLAFGPQLWWGANPTVMAKYRRSVGGFDLTLLHQEDVAQTGAVAGLSALIPETRRPPHRAGAGDAPARRRGRAGRPLVGLQPRRPDLPRRARTAPTRSAPRTPSAARPRSPSSAAPCTGTPQAPTWGWWPTPAPRPASPTPAGA